MRAPFRARGWMIAAGSSVVLWAAIAAVAWFVATSII